VTKPDVTQVQRAEVVLPCAELSDTLLFFTERLGFRVDAISPADDPQVAVLSAHGLRIRLVRGAAGAPGVLRLLTRDRAAWGEVTAPNGTRIEIVDADPPLVLPPARPSFALSRAADAATWVEGRAGMRYRDLVPGRQGGRFVASHIQIRGGGAVPDYVHFHDVRFQMIFCKAGSVRVVYEDQGPPFVLRAGDCVLQPPKIRHRVLESDAGVEVIEISSPAHHETFADHELSLPTDTLRPERRFGGQRFVRHEAAAATWAPAELSGFEARDTGIAAATDGLLAARVLRRRGGARGEARSHDGELLCAVVLRGRATLTCAGGAAERLEEGDAFALPPALPHALAECSDDLEILEVAVR
jgi:quercetin dioxygenase-like cupin family protein